MKLELVKCKKEYNINKINDNRYLIQYIKA